jgi:hypothetical protein
MTIQLIFGSILEKTYQQAVVRRRLHSLTKLLGCSVGSWGFGKVHIVGGVSFVLAAGKKTK